MPLVEQSESGNRCSFRLRRIGTAATFPGVSDTFKINKEITVVGRNPSSSDIFLDSTKNKVMISRLHARILTDKDETGKHAFRISDTSLNGTFINDIKIADTCDLNPGDTVTFGHLKGAVLNPGMLAEQPDSEFRFAFEKYPATPPDKKQLQCFEQLCSSSPEIQRQTPSPKTVKTGPKTPLFPAADMPDLLTFLTPATPGHEDACTATMKYTRLPDSIQGKQSWRQHFVGDSSDSDHSDDDIMVYAAAAGGAMEESDEEIFSVQLPESPESFDQTGAPAQNTDFQAPVNTASIGPVIQVSKGWKAKGSKAREEQKITVKKASKRPRKSSLPSGRQKAARKSSKPRETGHINQQDDDYMYNTCASVDCIHPHDKCKVVNWVQCDDCDDWYHVECTGLTLKSVQPKSVKFHCGCV